MDEAQKDYGLEMYRQAGEILKAGLYMSFLLNAGGLTAAISVSERIVLCGALPFLFGVGFSVAAYHEAYNFLTTVGYSILSSKLYKKNEVEQSLRKLLVRSLCSFACFVVGSITITAILLFYA